MSLLGDLLSKFGLHGHHDANVIRDSVPGVHLKFTRDLHPLPATGLTAGHLLELSAVLDETHPLPTAATKIRFDVLEEDIVFDDRVISLLGTGALPPVAGAATRQLTTTLLDLPVGQTVAQAVEAHKRAHAADYEDTMLILKQTPNATTHRGTQRTYIFAWLRVRHDDIGAHSELYFALDIADNPPATDGLHAASGILEIAAAPPGVSVRITGQLLDAAPLVAAPEPLSDIPVKLQGRASVSGPDGRFVIDARLAAGDHPLAFARSGINPLTLTVGVTIAPDGKATAAIRDAANTVIANATTTAAADELSLLALALPDPAPIVAHKLRGTVIWPDSRKNPLTAADHGTPLAQRRVYVLPVPAGTTISDLRPKSTRAWEELKRRDDVLRSYQPGRPAQAERTDASGRFELRYVDFTAGNNFLIWVERFDPLDAADQTTEAPDLIVRSFMAPLIQITAANLGATTNAGALVNPTPNRNLVDPAYSDLTGDVLPLGVDALRVADLGAPDGLSLTRAKQSSGGGARPTRASRLAFETAALTAASTDHLPIGASRVVGQIGAAANAPVTGGLELRVLPLVPVYEPPELQGPASHRAAAALAAAADRRYTNFTDPLGVQRLVGHDRAAVRLVVATARLDQGAIDLAVNPDANDPNSAQRAVKLLERTFIARPELANPEDAHWHIDGISLADRAFIGLGPFRTKVNGRNLAEPVHPVLDGISPVLPGLAARRLYLSPGHGLSARQGHETSQAPAQWESVRGGWTANAGEDEVDALIASDIAVMLDVCGMTFYTCRELYRFTVQGVAENAAGGMVPPAPPAANFPRLWQQNPFYYFRVVPQRPNVAGFSMAADRNGAGINARVKRMSDLAVQPAQIDIVLMVHTNAGGGGQDGHLAEYLNVFDAAGNDANLLAHAFATQIDARLVDRERIGPSNVQSMLQVQPPFADWDLVSSIDHWSNGDGPLADRRVAPGGAHWTHHQFPAGGGAQLHIPAANAEYAFHDNVDDSALLGRAWFRRIAADASVLATDAQLQADPAAVTATDIRVVLRRTFGNTPAVQALGAGAVNATVASLQAAVRAVGDANASAPPNVTLGDLASAAMNAAGALTRQGFVDIVTAAVREKTGWRVADADTAATLREWIGGGIAGEQPLDRPGVAVTRAEAAEIACTIADKAPASLRTAETTPAAAPLMRPAPIPGQPAGRSAYLGVVEGNLLAQQLGALDADKLYRHRDAYLADASWSRLDAPRGSNVYVIDADTPLTVVFHTTGIPWKTANQDATNGGVDDVEIRVDAGGLWATRLKCMVRNPNLVVSHTWFLDLAPGFGPAVVGLELWMRRRGTLLASRVSRQTVTVSVPRPTV